MQNLSFVKEARRGRSSIASMSEEIAQRLEANLL